MTHNNIKFNEKHFFVGVSLGNSASTDSGIAIIDRDYELLRVDKVYSLDEAKQYLEELTSKQNSIICVDLPKNPNTPSGKWRIESKFNKALEVNCNYKCNPNWTTRFSDRGSELCSMLSSSGYDIFRYNCFFTKTMLNINPPYKSRSPVACKCLQLTIKNRLNVSGIPSNMIPISGLDAIIGAYIARNMTQGVENDTYKFIGEHKGLPIVTAM